MRWQPSLVAAARVFARAEPGLPGAAKSALECRSGARCGLKRGVMVSGCAEVGRCWASAQPVDLGEFVAEGLGHGGDLAAGVVEKYKARLGHGYQPAVGWAGDAEGDVAAIGVEVH